RAAATVADALVRICGGASGLDAVDVGSLEVTFRGIYGPFNSALPEFDKISDAAYWDYQRSKVYARGGHYIWVFANLTTVAYVYAETRESTILEELLDGFRGVLVSDFYAAYDSVPCVQQKCLIHLMRDINDDLHESPFDDELKEIATRFGALLREIVKTIDAHGLKARHLG